MANAEIIAIGTELLLGHTIDTNTSAIAKKLNEIGIDIFRTSLVGDNIQRISHLINEALSRSDIIITTGGLGPTVDDPTRQAVADAMQTDLEFQPILWDQIQARFHLFNRQPTENNKRQAFIPRGAKVIENPVGTAPAFFYLQNNKMVISLPGVPAEMEYLLNKHVVPILLEKYTLSNVTFSRIIHTAGIGESSLDEIIGELETLSNPTVGLAAHPGQVDIRITAKAESKAKAMEMIVPVENKVRELLGEKVYGVDNEKLEDKLHELLDAHQMQPILYYRGLQKDLIIGLKDRSVFKSINEMSGEKFSGDSTTKSNIQDDHLIFLIQSSPRPDQCQLEMTFHLYGHKYNEQRSFALQSVSRDTLIEFYLYNFMRESIIKEKGE
jgi:competence/damage-inducible protein CinA-like protein